MTVFIESNSEELFARVVTYTHPSRSSKVRLVPVSHVGESSYYSMLLDIIGGQQCLYEGFNVKERADWPIDHLTQAFIHEKDFTEIVKLVDADPKYKKDLGLFKRFMWMHLSRENKALRDELKSTLLHYPHSALENTFKMAEIMHYSLDLLTLIQRLLADLLDISFQSKELDYRNDISKRDNWHNVDQKSSGSVKVRLTPVVINYLNDRTSTVLENLGALSDLRLIHNVKERRLNFVKAYIEPIFAAPAKELADRDHFQQFLMDDRNNLVIKEMKKLLDAGQDFNVFYGANHLIAFEAFLLSEGFILREIKLVTVFRF